MKLCLTWIILVVTILEVFATKKEEAKCQCGVFKSLYTETTDGTPVASKSPHFNFECDSDGKQSCSNMCKALAGASKEDGPKKLCELLMDTQEPFVPTIYYKACHDKTWTYTGMKPTLEVCCKNKEVIPCN